MEIDSNADGKLSRKELVSGFERFNLDIPEETVEEIMHHCDSDDNGYIDFTEFMTAVRNWVELSSTEFNEKIFRIYDTNNQGFISKDELKESLGGIEEEELNEFLQDVDTNGDGNVRCI